jgi:hypothetical protein
MKKILFVILAMGLVLSLSACGGNLENIEGDYVVVESKMNEHPVDQVITFEGDVATNMWIYDDRNQFAYGTSEANDGYTAMYFESYAGIDNFTYYLRKDGGNIEIYGAVTYSVRNQKEISPYFVIKKQ